MGIVPAVVDRGRSPGRASLSSVARATREATHELRDVGEKQDS